MPRPSLHMNARRSLCFTTSDARFPGEYVTYVPGCLTLMYLYDIHPNARAIVRTVRSRNQYWASWGDVGKLLVVTIDQHTFGLPVF